MTNNGIMSEYQDVVLQGSCNQDGVLLFEHSAASQGFAYQSRLWFTPTQNPNRAMKVMIVFPSGDEDNLDSFSKAFFPNFMQCGSQERRL